ncbi:prostate stem cell antigen isoform X3 [Cervus elaphus]|uniref:prostate stem cell antigen isoform X3 n=1 Tax=Cervus elaphus TaxID=9860 RepID=UPI001CC28A7E|nr:prostate stem cell antigen isoform X3 [Cervus elaphus]
MRNRSFGTSSCPLRPSASLRSADEFGHRPPVLLLRGPGQQQGLPVRAELQNHCWTERVEAIGLLTVTSKGCSSHCVEDARNSFGSKKNACAAPT